MVVIDYMQLFMLTTTNGVQVMIMKMAIMIIFINRIFLSSQLKI